ncbi:MAG: hypothetical protein CSA23_01415 [Deltaproteobacteria bacterium]|nr:MAG: hypothetical protein CSA23_01415 [Deltaproteobacteria bacterium]
MIQTAGRDRRGLPKLDVNDHNDMDHTDFRKILIVDDNPDIHRDFAKILESSDAVDVLDQLEEEIFGSSDADPSYPRYQYRLGYATQGKQALEMVTAATDCDDPFLLAFVDMRMPPGWNGLETIQRLWQADPRLQIVLCSAYSDHSWDEIQQRLGPTSNLLILKKPFDVTEVSQMAAALTEKWRLSKQAATKEETLTYMVERRTADLQEANRLLKEEAQAREQLEKQLLRAQKMEAIGSLAAGVAHDLNNVLSGIVSYPDLLLMDVDEHSPMHRKLKLIQQSGQKAAAIVQDMLTLGRRGVFNHAPFSLKSMIETYLESPEFETLCRQFANVRIDARLLKEPGRVQGAESQVEKCIMNLVSNSAEALTATGGTVTIELYRRDLDLPLDAYVPIPAGSYIVMSVADDGPGIAENDVDHIFEPFYTRKEMGRSGTGLGLAVVWGVVNDHRGFIDVTTRESAGTRIDLYFPAFDTSAAEQAPEGDGNPQEEKKALILVVDDIAEQREVGVALLEALGYEARAVASGEAALQVLAEQPVDLLLLDMIMDPGIDGLDTFKRARALHPGQRAVIASGYSKSSRVEKAMTMGASGFLRKPYRLQDLANVVADALKN